MCFIGLAQLTCVSDPESVSQGQMRWWWRGSVWWTRNKGISTAQSSLDAISTCTMNHAFELINCPPCVCVCVVESVRGARVLVTGASMGIGEQMAYHYARLGAQLVITARRENALQKVSVNTHIHDKVWAHTHTQYIWMIYWALPIGTNGHGFYGQVAYILMDIQ